MSGPQPAARRSCPPWPAPARETRIFAQAGDGANEAPAFRRCARRRASQFRSPRPVDIVATGVCVACTQRVLAEPAVHRFLQSPDDVVAVAIEGRISAADLDALIGRLEARLARHGTVHVFVEVRAIDRVDLAGFGAPLERAMPLMPRLSRLGRVALVADQDRLRSGDHVESALPPFAGYRVFTPDRRAEALAWVMSGADADR